MAYANGRVPLSLLVHLGGNLYMFPGMYQRWLNLVALVKQRHGVTLRITRGTKGWDDWNGYRSYEAQVVYRRELGGMAARAGYSSHGGSYQGRESGAIDVANWAAIGRDAFFKACRDVGLTPGTDSRENWHVVDYSPWAGPSGGGGGSVDIMNATQEAKLDAVLAALGAGGLAPSGSVVWPDTIMGNIRTTMVKVANLGAWMSEGGADVDAGSAKPGTVAARVINLDRQVTGADGFDTATSQSVAGRVIDIQNRVGITDAQIAVIAEAVVDAVKVELGGITVDVNYDAIATAVRQKFAAEPLK